VALLQDGFAVASVEYRLSGEATFPAQIHDCKGAVRFLRANADKYALDANAFGAWGSSAGGHLVALMGTAGDANELEGDVGGNAGLSSRVQAVCDWFGPTDLTVIRSAGARNPVSLLLGGPPAKKPDLARQASPVAHVSKDDSPFLIVHGDRDRLVPLKQSELLDEALRKAGVESRLHVVKGAGHGRFRDPAVMEMIRKFFRATLRKRRDDPGEQAVPDGSAR
jgi:acetyl esterase/lipase